MSPLPRVSRFRWRLAAWLVAGSSLGFLWGCLLPSQGAGAGAPPPSASGAPVALPTSTASCDPDAGALEGPCRIPTCGELMPDAALEDEPEPDCSELLEE